MTRMLSITLVLVFLFSVVGCQKKLQNTSGFVKVDSSELQYVIEGNGIPCLVVGSAIYYPKTFSQELREHFQFIFVDHRGFSPNITKDDGQNLTLNTFIDDMETVRKTLGLGKIAVLGHSIHGLFALEYAGKYPQNTSHVIMIGTPAYYGSDKFSNVVSKFWESEASDERKLIFKKNWETVTEETLSQLSPGEVFIKTYITDGPKWWVDPYYDCSLLWEGVHVNGEIEDQIYDVIFNEYDLTEISGQIRTPIFVAMGKYDYGVPYILWDEVKSNFQNLSFNLFENCGHTPQLEEPALFDKKLIEWFKSNKN